ncbi:hypothetical protein [Streptomyces sp. NPDC002599]|uniref:hypothetical protein n=1 Tax=Streptomyces sp. NPDC002599 TaxID=3154421 RepID=UPI00332A9BE3
MSRDDRTPDPTTGDDPAVPGKPTDPSGPESEVKALSPEPAGEASAPEAVGKAPAPASRFTVVISGDGSAAIDGEPVPSMDGMTVDAVILDVLHGYARDRGTTVTAAVSDPSAGYVAHVEVAPDGSSTLVDQREQPSGPAGDDSAEGSTEESAEEAAPDEPLDEDFDADAQDDDVDAEGENHDEDEGDAEDDADADADEFDGEAYTLEQRRRRESASPPPPPSPGGGGAPGARSGPQLVRRHGTRQSDDEYVGPGLLHRPLVVGPVALVAAALVIVPLVILGSGGSDDDGRRKQAARSSDETSGNPQAERSGPISTPSASIPPPPSPSASAKPRESKGAKESKGPEGAKAPRSGGGVTVTVTARPPQATVTAKPAQETAATAVNRLALNDPSGRHICYRAYVSGQGWQKPVCDGTMAGTSDRNRPIKALNIAVSGSGGSAANAFVHDPDSSNGQGRWEPQWTDVIADGRNNYIGSTKKSAPVMSGFAINIGSGRICQTAKVHGFDWGGQGCADARPGLVFGGALENDRWLEAVKFTV